MLDAFENSENEARFSTHLAVENERSPVELVAGLKKNFFYCNTITNITIQKKLNILLTIQYSAATINSTYNGTLTRLRYKYL